MSFRLAVGCAQDMTVDSVSSLSTALYKVVNRFLKWGVSGQADAGPIGPERPLAAAPERRLRRFVFLGGAPNGYTWHTGVVGKMMNRAQKAEGTSDQGMNKYISHFPPGYQEFLRFG